MTPRLKLDQAEEIRRSLKSFFQNQLRQSSVLIHTGEVINYTAGIDLIIKITDIALSTIEVSWADGHLIVLEGDEFIIGDSVILLPINGRFLVLKAIATNLLRTDNRGNSVGITFSVAANDASLQAKRHADYVCDGVADDIEIQAALDALPTQGGKVILSEGTFTIAIAINMPSNANLEGSGYNTRLNRTTAGDVINATGSVGTHLNNIVIENMRVTGPSVVGTQVGGVGIDLDYNDYSIIRSCWVSGFGSLGDDAAVRLRHSVACKVIDNYLSASKNGLVTGLSLSVDFPEADRCEISRNVAFDNFDDGLHSQQSARIVYNNNICYSNGEAGIDTLGDDGDIIVGNHCYNNTGAGIEIGNSTATGTPDDGHSIIGNVCNGNTTNGILLGNNTQYCSVIGNTIRDNVSHGMQIGGNSGKVVLHCNISDNVCENNVDGIRLVNNADENFVTNNVIRSNTGRGIYLVNAGIDAPTNNVVIGNKVSNNTTAQIAQNGDSGSIIRDNHGFVTENSGVATLANLTTSIVVNHGLDITPVAGDIMVTPIEAWGSMTQFFIDTYTATQFTIHSNVDPGQDVDFAWKAIKL